MLAWLASDQGTDTATSLKSLVAPCRKMLCYHIIVCEADLEILMMLFIRLLVVMLKIV